MKTVAIVEARMTSTRLPGKTMRPILGRPMLELLVERLKRAQTLDGIVVATTDNTSDDVIEQLTVAVGIGCFRGSEEDVLDRVLRAAKAAQADVIVEITGDCPLVDHAMIDRLVHVYMDGDYDFVSNVVKRTVPVGSDIRVFSTAALNETANSTQDPADHEHVSLYIYEHPEKFSLGHVESGLPRKYHDLRITVDTLEDFELITRIYEELYPVNPAFSLEDVLDLLERKPELIDINRHIRQKRVR